MHPSCKSLAMPALRLSILTLKINYDLYLSRPRVSDPLLNPLRAIV